MTSVARPIQIVRVGDESSFELCSENLEEVISQIQPGVKVGVVSVVGAFRTGKSFLLNFFLRYLRHGQASDLSEDWMCRDGDRLAEGNLNVSSSSAAESSEAGAEEQKGALSFGWRGGEERQTTGIWMWSKPFMRRCAKTGEEIAIILVDTQGMFDNETTMTTTAQIFGLSTLISSYQIYNVEKRIQEDNLQHLALFSEYGRMALEKPTEVEDSEEPPAEPAVESISEPLPEPPSEAALSSLPPAPPTEASASPSSTLAPSLSSESLAGEEQDGFVEVVSKTAPRTQTQLDAEEKAKVTAVAEKKISRVACTKPFQRLQFLVRDWQNFDLDWEEETTQGDYKGQTEVFERMQKSMDTYLFNVIKDRGMEDLQTTRDQIIRCFDTVDCFLLPHPGFSVTKKTFDGAIAKIEPSFRGLLNQYVRRVFDEYVEPKLINNRALTARELQQFFEVYCRMFQDTDSAGKGSFPKAMTMLEATSEANNRNAFDIAKGHYTKTMDLIAGVNCSFIKEHILMEHHAKALEESFGHFDEIATMGPDATIATFRSKLVAELESQKVAYIDSNALRNPFKDLEFYLLPGMIAFVSFFIAYIIDASCGHAVCEATELAFTRIYGIALFVVVVLAWKHIHGAWFYLKEVALPLLMKQ